MIFIVANLALIVSALFYMFNIEVLNSNYIKDSISYELTENDYDKHREYLLAKTNQFITERLNELNDESIHNLLSNIGEKQITYGEKSYVKYDKAARNIVLVIYPDVHKVYKVECYRWRVEDPQNKKIKYIYIKSQGKE